MQCDMRLSSEFLNIKNRFFCKQKIDLNLSIGDINKYAVSLPKEKK